MHGVADLIDRSRLVDAQIAIVIEGFFFKKTVNRFGRFHEIKITASVLVLCRKDRAVLLNVEGFNDSSGRCPKRIDVLFIQRPFKDQEALFFVLFLFGDHLKLRFQVAAGKSLL